MNDRTPETRSKPPQTEDKDNAGTGSSSSLDHRRSAPDPQRKAPDSRHTAPDAQRNAPDAQRKAPDAQRQAPDSQRQAPDAQRKAPDAQRKAPDSQRKAPDSQRKAPDSQRKAPDSQRKAPDSQRKAPDAQRKAPDSQRKAPDSQRKAPDSQRKAPDARHTAPDAQRLAPFARRMRREQLPETVIRTFAHYYQQLLEGHTGLIPEDQIRPVRDLPDVEAFSPHLAQSGQRALQQTVLIKLNGGLGTSMGLERAKSVLPIKEGLTFLDVIARQARHAGVPLVLMNSFNTRRESLQALARYDWLAEQAPPLDFLQHKIPRIARQGLAPISWPQDPELEWCPPGHGDIYTALVTSGMLQTLLEEGYRYAFVANADNLGAALDPTILGYFATEELPFMMEVADRTAADRKGGHLAQTPQGRLLLRESAQCPPEDSDAFQDIDRHRYFNTNNLWLHLPSLQRLMDERDNLLGLPMIRNEKTVDPRDPDTPPVYQLETAMGSAIAVFEGAGAVRVPRSRFTPVKTTDDLLAVRSDAYTLTGDYRIVIDPRREIEELVVALDRDHYRLVDQLERRFPHGPPSLLHCRRFHVLGDVTFGRDVLAVGEVEIINQSGGGVRVEDGRRLRGEVKFM